MEEQPLKNMTVGLLHYSCPPVIGGTEFILEAHARWLHKYGAEVRVVVGKGEQFAPEIPVLEVPEFASDYSQKKQIMKALSKGDLNSFERQKQHCIERLTELFDGCHKVLVHNLFTMPFNLPLTAALVELAETAEFEIVPWTHDIAWLDEKYDTPDEYPWNLLGQPAGVENYVAISGLRKRQLAELFGEQVNITVIHDGIEFDEFHELDPEIQNIYRKNQMYYDDLLALYPARIVQRKNFELALEIIYHLKKLGYTLHFIITGPPDPHNPESLEYFESLKSLRNDLDLEDEVIFCYDLKSQKTGEPLKISYNRMRQFYRLSDLLLFTSKQEGFGLPLLEAGLSRTLICCSDIEPLPEVGGEAPFYFNPNEHPSIIAYQIREEIESQAATLLQRRVRKNFTWPAIFEQYIIPFLTD